MKELINRFSILTLLLEYDEEKSRLFLVCMYELCHICCFYFEHSLPAISIKTGAGDVHQNEHARDLTLIELKKILSHYMVFKNIYLSFPGVCESKSNHSHTLTSTTVATMILQYGTLMDDLQFCSNEVMSCSGYVQ
uniref:Uncharacterized protein n=1 Tax=Glossina pallidipes TaxID=7398 RepID=A0A1A9ZXB5_GLOPL